MILVIKYSYDCHDSSPLKSDALEDFSMPSHDRLRWKPTTVRRLAVQALGISGAHRGPP